MAGVHECGEDTAAYVLGALEPHEADAFRRHLATCVVCRDEVETFQQVVDTLPSGTAQYRVPKPLRKRVLVAVRAEPRPNAPASARRRSWSFLSGLAIARPAPTFAAAAAVVLLVIGGVLIGSGGSSGVHVFRASVGNAEVRLVNGHAELIVRRLPQPPPGKIYEVWLQRGKHAPSPTTTLFSVTSQGTADVGVPGNLHGVSAVMVTPEPDGGSLVPTHAPVIITQLA